MADATSLRQRSPLLRFLCRERQRPLTAANLLAQSPLPEAIRSLVAEVIRRTGGGRRERSDIARELLAHFDDALGRGRSAEEAIADFGDSATAATLLRRAMLRKRGALWQSWRWTRRGALALLLLCASAYAIVFVRYHASRPVITIDSEARLSGLVTLGPPDERAWPILREALPALKAAEEAYFAREDLSADRRSCFDARGANDPAWAEAAALLAAHQAQLERLRSAAMKPHLGIGYVEFDAEDVAYFGERLDRYGVPDDFKLLVIPLPHLGDVQHAARWIIMDAKHALAAGEGRRFVENVAASIALARLTHGPLLVEQLVAGAILHRAFETILDSLALHPDVLDASALADLAAILESVPADSFRPDLTGERIFVEDLVQRIYSDDGRGDGRLVATHLDFEALHEAWGVRTEGPNLLTRAAAPLAALAAPSRRQVIERFEQSVANADRRAETPTWEWTSESFDEFHSGELARLVGFALMFAPDTFDKSVQAMRMIEHRHELAILVTALLRFQRAHGAWPASLDELTPDLLAALPLDPYDGRPIRFAMRDGVPSLWSVGPDRVEHGPIEYEPLFVEQARLLGYSPTRPPSLPWPEADLLLWTPTPDDS